MYITALSVVGVLFLWTVGSLLVVRNIEEPRYTLKETKDGYQIRDYAPVIAAQTEVNGDYKEALNQGFGIIADYIFGNNTAKQSIAMTAPVVEKKGNEPIAMTAPVIESGSDSVHTISFIMPSKYTLDNLPKPNNAAVQIREIPARTVAVLSFAWYAGADKVAAKKAELSTLLARDGIATVGEYEYAGYNPPFSAPWIRRNEILVTIK